VHSQQKVTFVTQSIISSSTNLKEPLMKSTMLSLALVSMALVLVSAICATAATVPTFSGSLVFDLNANSGITQSGGNVSAWQSTVGTDTLTNAPGNATFSAGDSPSTPFGSPLFVAHATPNGSPAVSFNPNPVPGAVATGGQALGLSGVPADFPGGTADRTVFVVAQYNNTNSNGNFAGFEYGGNTSGTLIGPYAIGSAFSVAAQGDNTLVSDVWGNNVNPGGSHTGVWLGEASTLSGGTVTLYDFNKGSSTTANQVGTNTFGGVNTGTNGVTLGVELDGNSFGSMLVSEVLVYKGLLSPTQIGDVNNYINQQWFLSTPEPSSFVLLGSAIGALGIGAVRRRNSTVAAINK
jgi:hypothetical protein